MMNKISLGIFVDDVCLIMTIIWKLFKQREYQFPAMHFTEAFTIIQDWCAFIPSKTKLTSSHWLYNQC